MMNITNKANNTVLSSTLLAPAAPVSQLTFAQKKQLCIGWLSTEFQAYQRAGGQESLQAWVQSQILQALRLDRLHDPHTNPRQDANSSTTGRSRNPDPRPRNL